MNNSQSNTESINNLSRQNSPGYCKQKSRTVTFAADTTECGKGHVPDLQNKGTDAKNETRPQRYKARITVIRKHGILNCDAVTEHTLSRIKCIDSNIRDRWDKGLQDKTDKN